MSLGSTLKSAREAKGLTASQIAAKTHILVQTVEGLETGDYSSIPAPFYGRGFVKLYAECVGLDPKPLQAEFMEILNGRQPTDTPPPQPPPPPPGAVPPKAVPPPPAPARTEPEPAVGPEPAVEAEPPPALRGLALFDPAARPPEEPAPAAPVPPRAAPSRASDLFSSSYDTPESAEPAPLERFHDALSAVSHGVLSTAQRLPRNTGRLAVVAVAAGLIVAATVWGVTLLHRATSGVRTETPAAEKQPAEQTKPAAQPKPATVKQPAAQAKPAAQPKPAAPAKPGKLHATGAKVPALYVD